MTSLLFGASKGVDIVLVSEDIRVYDHREKDSCHSEKDIIVIFYYINHLDHEADEWSKPNSRTTDLFDVNMDWYRPFLSGLK